MILYMQLCICHLCIVGFLISLSFFTLRSGWAGCLSSFGFSSTCVGCTWGLCRWSFSPSSRWGLILATLQLESKSYCPWLCLASVSQTFPTVSPLVPHQQSLAARHEVEAFLINAARIECAISLWTCLWHSHIHAQIHTHAHTYHQLCRPRSCSLLRSKPNDAYPIIQRSRSQFIYHWLAQKAQVAHIWDMERDKKKKTVCLRFQAYTTYVWSLRRLRGLARTGFCDVALNYVTKSVSVVLLWEPSSHTHWLRGCSDHL